jgi:hypothetical protein
MAHGEYMYQVEASLGGLLRRAPLPALGAGIGDVIFGYDMANGEPTPTFETGGNLSWTSDGLNSNGWFTPKLSGGNKVGSTLTLNGTSNGSPASGYVLLQTNGQNVGIGTFTPGSPLDILNSVATNNTAINLSSTGTATTGNLTGASIVNALNPSSGTFGNLSQGLFARASVTNNNALNFNATTSLLGLYGQTRHQGTGSMSGALSSIGVEGQVQNSNTGTTHVGIGLYSQVGSNVSGGSVDTAYGVYIDNFTRTGHIGRAYGIYQAEAADSNYFAGSVGIGTAFPSTMFSIAEKFNVNSSGQLTKINNVLASASTGKFVLSDGTSGTWSGYTMPSTAGTIGKHIESDGTNLISTYETDAGAITGASGAIANSDTKIVSSTTAMGANRLQAGTVIRITLHGTCTSTAAGAGTITLRYGTNGTTADAACEAWTLGAAQTSGTTIPFTIECVVTIRTTGASATADGGLTLVNSGTTGLSTTATQVVRGTNTTINTATASTFWTVSYISGNASTACTFQQAVIESVFQ